ncbi:signal peptide, CUB and EGF-like domain-containing protein 1 isoform X2 [Pristis pectinata]|uniref:signal peptide, CUB and EGF-like domain-containing protein 1 isoform X2 n=1 Tax=Pristis pectinata TaxID=685728 RepID=UPI00223E01F4|nr:signal peptide, CUB and EGF-like domain-containing protein 1 isoform X2 [Pristis pectinata]
MAVGFLLCPLALALCGAANVTELPANMTGILLATDLRQVDLESPGMLECPGNQVVVGNGSACGCPEDLVSDGEACGCPSGFRLMSDGQRCVDVDECILPQACPSNMDCHNCPGSFVCECLPGYVRSLDGQSCVDVDECAFEERCRRELGNQCINVPGSYNCSCQPGFQPQGAACLDIDECSEDAAVCAQGQCVNTLGSYQCGCPPGFRGNGTDCEDENECASGGHGCDTNARCCNIIDSYYCQCYLGFNGDGFSCFDILFLLDFFSKSTISEAMNITELWGEVHLVHRT